MIKLNLFILITFLSLEVNATAPKTDFKVGIYKPLTNHENCVETVLKWDGDTLEFGKDRFSNFDKEEVKFSGASKNEKGDTCDMFWQTKLESRTKISVTITTKCPTGSKYNYTNETKQTFAQSKNKITFDASASIDGAVEASSHCEYELKKSEVKKAK